MPRIFRAIGDEFNHRFSRKDTAPVNSFEGFTSSGAVMLRDRRGTLKAELPNVSEKSETLGSDPLATYKPSGAKHVDAAKAMENFTGLVYPAVNAIAREVSNIQFRLYQVNGDDQEEVDPDHELLTLLDGVNEHMTGPELKYVTMAHLELAGNFYWLLDGVNNDTDKPRAIYPLNPGRVRVKLNKSTFRTKSITTSSPLTQKSIASRRTKSYTVDTPVQTTRMSASASCNPFLCGSTATTTRWSTKKSRRLAERNWALTSATASRSRV